MGEWKKQSGGSIAVSLASLQKTAEDDDEHEHDDDEEDLRRRTPRPESSEWAKIPLLFIKEARPPGTAMRVGIGRSGLVDPEVLFRF